MVQFRGGLKLAFQSVPHQFAGPTPEEQDSVSGLVYLNMVILGQGWHKLRVDLDCSGYWF